MKINFPDFIYALFVVSTLLNVIFAARTRLGYKIRQEFNNMNTKTTLVLLLLVIAILIPLAQEARWGIRFMRLGGEVENSCPSTKFFRWKQRFSLRGDVTATCQIVRVSGELIKIVVMHHKGQARVKRSPVLISTFR